MSGIGCSIFFLFLLNLNPARTIQLDKEFSLVNCYNNQIYLAPRAGKAIYQLTSNNDLVAIPFTDEANYRIYDFFVTPFVIYINNGRKIEKFYLSSGIKETNFDAEDIPAFTMNWCEEVILADGKGHSLLFLDPDNQVKLARINLSIKDLQFSKGIIYALTRNSIILLDEYGNILSKREIPERLAKIYVAGKEIYLYSPKKNYFYLYRKTWQKIEYPLQIVDICTSSKELFILSGNGTILYIYNKSDL